MTCLICLMIDISPLNVQPPLISSYAAEMEKLQADKEIRVNWTPVGRIYEHLACYYLSSVGITAEIKDGAGYDLLCETPNGVFFKVEVKSVSHGENGKLRCHVKNKQVSDVLFVINRNTNFLAIKYRSEFINASRIELSKIHFTAEKTQSNLRWLAKVAGNYSNSVNSFSEYPMARLNK